MIFRARLFYPVGMFRLGLVMAWFTVVMGVEALADSKGAGAPAPTSCGPSEKLFQCHRRAVELHLGLGAPTDLPTAEAIYSSACERNYAASCNNLSVLLITSKTVANNAAALFDRACKLLDLAACDNDRRLKAGAEFAVKLSFPPFVFDDVAEKLAGAACSAGDVFQCSDGPTKNRVAALLSRECRGGEIGQCVDAAMASNEAGYVELMTIACSHRVGKACYGLAKKENAADKNPRSQQRRWKTACFDAELDAGNEDLAARNEACLQIVAKKSTQRGLLLSVANANEQRCKGGEVLACVTALKAFDAAGSAARAFALAQHQCESASDCRELSDRYALGRGTARSIPKALELEPTCDSSRSWEVCRVIAAYLDKSSPDDAAQILDDHCEVNHEACYVAARRIESAKTWCRESVDNLHSRYSSLCALNIRDSCARKKKMCQLAQSELLKSRLVCGWGSIGDGSFRPPYEYYTVERLCPPSRWSSDTKRIMQSLEQHEKETMMFPR